MDDDETKTRTVEENHGVYIVAEQADGISLPPHCLSSPYCWAVSSVASSRAVIFAEPVRVAFPVAVIKSGAHALPGVIDNLGSGASPARPVAYQGATSRG